MSDLATKLRQAHADDLVEELDVASKALADAVLLADRAAQNAGRGRIPDALARRVFELDGWLWEQGLAIAAEAYGAAVVYGRRPAAPRNPWWWWPWRR